MDQPIKKKIYELYRQSAKLNYYVTSAMPTKERICQALAGVEETARQLECLLKTEGQKYEE